MEAHRRDGFSWLEAGQGRPLLFLHPVVSTSAYWRPQLDAFAPERRCLALDAPGFSAVSGGVSNPDSLAKRMVEFLDLVGVEQTDVVGLSLGGGYAMYTAAAAPERFGQLVLADTSLAFGIDPRAWLADWLAPVDRGQSPAELIDGILDDIVHRSLGPAARAELLNAAESITDDGFRAASAVIAAHDAHSLIPALTHHTLALVGAHDGETPPSYSEAIAEALPHAELAVIAHAGHLSSFEQPDEFNRIVGEFLDA